MEWTGRQQIIIKTALADTEGTFREAMIERKGKIGCMRCGSQEKKDQLQLPNGVYYCPACIEFGRITSDAVLFTPTLKIEREDRAIFWGWQGQLTVYQQRVADKLQQQFEKRAGTMVWAVTGAGKTEMLFPVIYSALKTGGRVAVVSPRIDVCRELFPRFKEAFPQEDILLSHGAAEEDYRDTAFLVATTHQLLHFYQVFDLLIIDEIDAFPYEGDSRLYFASKQAVKKDGCLIYLTATPSEKLVKEVSETFSVEKLPLRFHQRPLIEPKLVWFHQWERLPQSLGKLKRLAQVVKNLRKKNRVLIFCPKIEWMKALVIPLQKILLDYQIQAVSAEDEQRLEKVQQMREEAYDVLLCTTILERGVTFADVSVIVIGANHPVFSKSALVQIAGRVDRKGEFNQGEVLFFYDQQTRSIRNACKEIREMNLLAKKWLET